MSNCILHLGSNIGDRFNHMQKANRFIEKMIGPIVVKSDVYETAPWGNVNQGDFLNSAVIVHSAISPFEMLDRTQAIEIELGRESTTKWAPRIIDIDIILFDQLILQSSSLTTPHPYMARRNFVLIPISQIAPEWIDPISKLSLFQMQKQCEDNGLLRQYKI